MANRHIILKLVLTAGSLLVGSAGLAQTNLETNAAIQFNFSVPGAASLGMGGAFLALADDSTAAYTNPAGLTQIPLPEFQIEARGFGFTHVFTDRGRLKSLDPLDPGPTMIGVDTTAGLVDGEATDQVAGISFLSYVHPFEHWTLSLYRHEVANFEARFETQGAFLDQTRTRSPLGIPGEPDGRLASLRNAADLEIANFGIAAAYRVSPSFSLGAGVSYYDFSLDTLAERFIPPLPDPPVFTDAPANFQTQRGEDSDWGLLVGFLWEISGGEWRIGGAFRQGPSFDIATTSESELQFDEFFETGRFHVPTVYGIGVAYQASDAVRLTLDVDHVEYSVLTEDFFDIFGLGNFFDKLDDDGNLIKFDTEVEKFKVDDASEIHFGFEYFFLERGVAVRAGAWLDPDHRLRFEGANKSFGAIFQAGSDEMHYSFGIGVSYPKYQLHAGFDYSKRVSTGALSVIFFF